MQNMLELKMRLEELQMENEYQLRLKDMNYNEKMKETSDKFTQQIKSLQTAQQVWWTRTTQIYSMRYPVCVNLSFYVTIQKQKNIPCI